MTSSLCMGDDRCNFGDAAMTSSGGHHAVVDVGKRLPRHQCRSVTRPHNLSITSSSPRFFPWLLVLMVALETHRFISPANASKGVYSGDYCDTEVFRAECADGEVIILQKTLYGRLKIGRCVEIDLGYIGCFTDVLLAADRRCSGKRVCEIRVPDAEFESTRPCLKELKTYLEASYKCVPVETVTTDYCKANDQLNVSATSGYIASVVTSDTPYCDGSSHPWLIVGQPGQTINLTLYDFALQETGSTGIRHHYNSNSASRRQGHHHQQQQQQVSMAPVDSPSVASIVPSDAATTCVQYGLIEDSGTRSPTPTASGSGSSSRGLDRPTTICSNGRDRVRHIYRSVGHIVRVWVTAGSAPTDLKRFLIHYSVTGCPDPEIPAHAWFTRSTDGNGIMGCRHSDDTSDFQCVDSNWKGTSLNCSEFPPPPVIDKLDSETNARLLSYGKHLDPSADAGSNGVEQRRTWLNSRVLSIGILIGTLIGAVCLIVIIISILLRRRRVPHDENSNRQSVLLRKRQTEVDSKMTAVTADYFYDATASTDGYTKRPPANVPETNGKGPLSSPAAVTEPLMATCDRRTQQQHHLAAANGTNEHHVVTVRCWPNDRGVTGSGADVTMTSCSTFKMTPDLATNCVGTFGKDGGYVMPLAGNGLL